MGRPLLSVSTVHANIVHYRPQWWFSKYYGFSRQYAFTRGWVSSINSDLTDLHIISKQILDSASCFVLKMKWALQMIIALFGNIYPNQTERGTGIFACRTELNLTWAIYRNQIDAKQWRCQIRDINSNADMKKVIWIMTNRLLLRNFISNSNSSPKLQIGHVSIPTSTTWQQYIPHNNISFPISFLQLPNFISYYGTYSPQRRFIP